MPSLEFRLPTNDPPKIVSNGMDDMTRIAFVGLGAMGLPMAGNLLSNGFAVTGYDLNAKALDALEGAGGKRAATAAEAANGADILILMVVNAAQAEAVLFEGGARGLATRRRGGDHGDLSAQRGGSDRRSRPQGRTSPDRLPRIGRGRGCQGGKAHDHGGGAKGHIRYREAGFRCSRRQGVPRRRAPGQGAMVKTVNQLLCGVHIAVVAEAFALAAKVGVDLGILLEIMGGSSASSWMLKDRGPRMLEAEPEVTSAVDIFVKDLGIVLDAGRDVKAALPLAAVAQQMFLATSGRGDGKADDSQVIRSYLILNGID